PLTRWLLLCPVETGLQLPGPDHWHGNNPERKCRSRSRTQGSPLPESPAIFSIILFSFLVSLDYLSDLAVNMIIRRAGEKKNIEIQQKCIKEMIGYGSVCAGRSAFKLSGR